MDIANHLLPKHMQAHRHALAMHVVEVDSAVTPEQALDPNFWPHLAQRFRLGDEVIIRPRDFSYRLHAEVVAIDKATPPHWAMLRSISLTQGGVFAEGAMDASGYWHEKDPVQGWRVLRGPDLIAHGIKDEATAKAVLADLKAGKPFRQAKS